MRDFHDCTRMALQGGMASLQEIARYLNRSASSLSKLLARDA
jgi:DNA-binding CsgD family transcriptional regulator